MAGVSTESPAGLIRPARPDEAEAIAALIQSAYRGDSSRAGWTTEADLIAGQRTTPENVAGELADPRNHLLVLEDAAGLLACCQVSDRGGARAYFGAFAVRPGAQGAGTGRRMVAAAEALAVARGARTLEMQVLEPRAELIAWYERLGFARTGERRPFPTDLPPSSRTLVPDLRFVVLAKAL